MASRIAWFSIGVSFLLSLLNLAVAAVSGSLAVAAEMVHNLVDLMASVAVLTGVKLSERKSRAFPYGLYKIENLVTVGVAILVFVTAYEIAHRALLAKAGPTTVNGWVLAGVALSAIIPLAFSHYEMRLGRVLNSPALTAAAQEYRVHVFTSGGVFLALIGRGLGLPLDRYAALVLVVVLGKTGWDLLTNGMRVLLDASLDPAVLDQVRSIIQADPMIAEVHSLVGRNAGRYRFLETEVTLRVDNLAKAHAVSQRLEAAIRAKVPHVERVLVHYEPQARSHWLYAVPLVDADGTISPHFGSAPYFALMVVRVADGRIESQEILTNPHQNLEKARGIHTAEWLASLKSDVVLMRDDVTGAGPSYVFADSGIEVRHTESTSLAQVTKLLYPPTG